MTAIVQINFDYDTSFEELTSSSTAVAPKFQGVEGLLWKVWLGNDELKGAGGIYLFDTRENANAYAQGPMVAGLKQRSPTVEVKVFDVLDAPSAITNAPVSISNNN